MGWKATVVVLAATVGSLPAALATDFGRSLQEPAARHQHGRSLRLDRFEANQSFAHRHHSFREPRAQSPDRREVRPARREKSWPRHGGIMT